MRYCSSILFIYLHKRYKNLILLRAIGCASKIHLCLQLQLYIRSQNKNLNHCNNGQPSKLEGFYLSHKSSFLEFSSPKKFLISPASRHFSTQTLTVKRRLIKRFLSYGYLNYSQTLYLSILCSNVILLIMPTNMFLFIIENSPPISIRLLSNLFSEIQSRLAIQTTTEGK